jgi:glycosyltransferase involved in cell wall biosynthesis
MRIIIASTIVPFVRGGARTLATSLTKAFVGAGHEVDEILLPFWSDPDVMVEQMLALRLLDVSHDGDLLVCLRTPSYLLRHPNKVVWFLHHHRPAYDLQETPYADPVTPHSATLLDAIYESDAVGLGEARKVYAVSAVVAERLRRFNDLSCPVLYPPFDEADQYRCDNYGDYVFFPSRIAPLKRQALALEAMAHVQSDVRLVIAGQPDLPDHLEPLRELIDRHHLDDRVELLGEWIDEERKRQLYAGALAVLYPPQDEDGLGYVTLESFAAAKPVVTCTDSGGPLEVVEHDINGRVVPPEPHLIARALDQLANDPGEARHLGVGARDTLRKLDLSGETIVETLTK